MDSGVAGANAARELLARDEVLRKKISRHALSLTRNAADAKELAQQCIAKAIDPHDSPWQPDRQPNLFLHIGSLMNSAAANRRRAKASHPDVDYDTGTDLLAGGQSTAEELVIRAEERRALERRIDELRGRLAGDAIALGKIDLLYRGIDDIAEQATELGCSVEDVYRAHERIAYHVRILRKALAGGARARVTTEPETVELTASAEEPES